MSNRAAADRAHLAPRKSTSFRAESKEDPAIHRLSRRLSKFFKEKPLANKHGHSDSDSVLFRSALANPWLAVREPESESDFESVDWTEMLKDGQSMKSSFALETFQRALWNTKKKEPKPAKKVANTDTSATSESPRESTSTSRPTLSTSNPLPKLPANAYFPKYDTKDFDFALSKAVHELQNDTTSGARQLADAALQHLREFTKMAAGIAITRVEFWTLIVRAAKQLSTARPSMGAAVTACLLRTLEHIISRWTEERVEHQQEITVLAELATNIIDEIAKERQEVSKKLSESFTLWLKDHCSASVRIVTLSNSSTIRAAILYALAALPDVTFRLTVLESRPRCEGADMAAQLYAAANDPHRLHITIMPDCAVGQATKDIDLVLLGADRISATGDVSNKIGSLTTSVCAKSRRKKIPVVVLSDIDKIAGPGSEEESPEQHPASELSSAWASETKDQLEGKENVEVFGDWFEWVPAKLVNAYVTELGVLDVEQVERLANEVKDLEESIFGASQELTVR